MKLNPSEQTPGALYVVPDNDEGQSDVLRIAVKRGILNALIIGDSKTQLAAAELLDLGIKVATNPYNVLINSRQAEIMIDMLREHSVLASEPDSTIAAEMARDLSVELDVRAIGLTIPPELPTDFMF